MKTHVARVPEEYDVEIEDMIKKIHISFGIKIPKITASKIILLKSKNTTYTLTERKLLELLGS